MSCKLAAKRDLMLICEKRRGKINQTRMGKWLMGKNLKKKKRGEKSWLIIDIN
jgi:hypothetical protein